MRQSSAYGTSGTETVSLAEIVRRILRGYRVLASFGLAGGALAMLHLTLSPATYQAEARIAVDPRPLRLPGQALRSRPIDEGRTAMALLEGEVRILRSAPVLLDVVDRLRLDGDGEFATPDRSVAERAWQAMSDLVGLSAPVEAGAPKPQTCRPALQGATDCLSMARLSALRGLQEAVTVRRSARSFEIVVRARSEERAKAVRIADAVVAAYVSENRRSGAERLDEARRTLTSGLPALEDDLRTRERQVVDASRALQAVRGSAGNVDEQQLKQVAADRVNARVRTQALKVRSDQIASLLRSGADLDAEAFPESPALEALRLQASALARQEGAASVKLGSRHPETIVLKEQRVRLQARLRQELIRTAQAIRNDYEQARATDGMLSARADALEGKVLATSTAMVELRRLRRIAATDEAVLASSSRRAVELGQGDLMGQASVRVLGSASPPAGPATPRLSLIAVAVAAGLTTGAACLAIRTRPEAPGGSGRPHEASSTGRT